MPGSPCTATQAIVPDAEARRAARRAARARCRGRRSPRARASCGGLVLERARDVGARADAELGEHVAQVRLDRLLAEEERLRRSRGSCGGRARARRSRARAGSAPRARRPSAARRARPRARSSRRISSRTRCDPHASSSDSAWRSAATASLRSPAATRQRPRSAWQKAATRRAPAASASAAASSAFAAAATGSPCGEQHGGPAARGGRRRDVQPERRRVLLGPAHVRVAALDPPERELDEPEDLPVEAALDRDLVGEVVVAERVHDLPRLLDLPGLEARAAELPPGPAARPRASCRRPSGARPSRSPRPPRSPRRGCPRGSAPSPARRATRRGSGRCRRRARPRPRRRTARSPRRSARRTRTGSP